MTDIRIHTAAAVAELLHKSEPWVTATARAGLLPGRKTGRTWAFTDADIEAYLERVATGQATAAPAPRRRRRSAAA